MINVCLVGGSGDGYTISWGLNREWTQQDNLLRIHNVDT